MFQSCSLLNKKTQLKTRINRDNTQVKKKSETFSISETADLLGYSIQQSLQFTDNGAERINIGYVAVPQVVTPS